MQSQRKLFTIYLVTLLVFVSYGLTKQTSGMHTNFFKIVIKPAIVFIEKHKYLFLLTNNYLQIDGYEMWLTFHFNMQSIQH